ncbi:MAG: glycosyltransferase family 2 protein [Rhodocyclaceae bacterium]|nr:glycosyltransferase family 2 protein [Rhodocyclaceae bacterium]
MSAPRVAVITAYHRESRGDLQRCLDSVAAQSHPCTHFLVSDGHPQDFLDGLPVRHVRLGVAHADYGDTPRAVGSLLAVREDFDAIAYLDADNFYLPDHVGAMLEAAAAAGNGFDVITARRFFVRPDGSRLPVADEPHDRHTDTSCYLILRGAFPVTPLWALMPRPFSVIGDRVIWRAILARGCKVGHLPRESVGYRSLWKAHYAALGEDPPADAKEIGGRILETARWWFALGDAEKAPITRLLGFDPGTLFAPIAR